MFKSFRKQVKIKLGIAHDNYVKDLLDTSQHDKPKRFWSYIKSQTVNQIMSKSVKQLISQSINQLVGE